MLLVDKYEVIVKVWHYLQAASPGDILGLPEPKFKGKLPSGLGEGERLLMGFLMAGGSYSPRTQAGLFTNYKEDKKRISSDLPKIKHWVIQLGSYLDISNESCTWFVDPPYFKGGHKYIESNDNLDFVNLATWCRFRQGQVIVCENTKASWLPFWPLKNVQGSRSTNTTEAMWCNDLSQPRLF